MLAWIYQDSSHLSVSRDALLSLRSPVDTLRHPAAAYLLQAKRARRHEGPAERG
jgi:hypothetical protein